MLADEIARGMPGFPRIADGFRVGLRPLGKQDYADLYRWNADLQDLHILTGPSGTPTFEQFSQWMDLLATHTMVFVAFEKPDERLAGFVQASDVNLVDGRCYMTTYFIPEYRSRWIGREASVLFLDYMFRTFNLRKIYADVADFNQGQLLNIRLYVEEGRYRQHLRRDGQYWDSACYAIYRDRWLEMRELIFLLCRITPDEG